MCSTELSDVTAEENLIKNDTDPGNDVQSTGNENFSKEDQQKVDQVKISAIKEELRGSLLSIASKLLSSEHTRLHHLSRAEQQLWNLFAKSDIYEFLTGEKDCIPEFQFNWISPEAPAIRWVISPTTGSTSSSTSGCSPSGSPTAGSSSSSKSTSTATANR